MKDFCRVSIEAFKHEDLNRTPETEQICQTLSGHGGQRCINAVYYTTTEDIFIRMIPEIDCVLSSATVNRINGMFLSS